MELSAALQNKIVDYLKTLPNIDDSKSQRAFIYSAGLDMELQEQIKFADSISQFVTLLVNTLLRYGKLNNGKYAIEAVLLSSQNYVGPDKQDYCMCLIQELYKTKTLDNQNFLLICPNCGMKFKKGNFCIECGVPLSSEMQSLPSPNPVNNVAVEEIVAWIKSKLEIHGVEHAGSFTPPPNSNFASNDKGYKKKFYKIISFTEPVIILEVDERFYISGCGGMSLKKPREQRQYSVDLSKLISNIVTETFPKKNGAYLKFQSSHSEPTIKYIGEYEESDRVFMKIFINDTDMAKRVATAFYDAIKICGGKDDLY